MIGMIIYFFTCIGLVLFVLTLASHATLYGEFKYYKPIYEAFERGDYSYKKIGAHHYFVKGFDEIVFFPDNAIKITHSIYINLTFVQWFSPYSMYYLRKFNKVKDRIIAQHMFDELFNRELNRWGLSAPVEDPRDTTFADYGTIGNGTPVVKDIKPFKLLRG